MGELKRFTTDKLRVIIASDRAAMGEIAGRDAAEAIKKAIAARGEANVMFAAAPSQNDTLATLCADGGVDWSTVNAFHMDEYIGLPEDHPAGFRNFLKKAIFNKFPFKSVNLLNGNAENIDGEIARYSELLDEHPLDVVILGIGENGHIAFNEPSVADFQDKANVKRVKLEEVCRMQQVHDGCFTAINEVPTHALSVTIPPMIRGKVMICSAPCATKAHAAERMVNGEVSVSCPASVLRTHGDATLYLDADSGRELLKEKP